MTDGIKFSPVFNPPRRLSKDEEKRIEEEKLKKAEEAEKQKKAEEKAKKLAQENELRMLQQQLESADEQAEGTADSFEAFGKCLTIAQRITRGDNVPTKDMKYLMEHEPDLYKQAIMMRRPNDDPKDYDSVLDEDDTEGQTNEASPSFSEAPTTEISTDVSVDISEAE